MCRCLLLDEPFLILLFDMDILIAIQSLLFNKNFFFSNGFTYKFPHSLCFIYGVLLGKNQDSFFVFIELIKVTREHLTSSAFKRDIFTKLLGQPDYLFHLLSFRTLILVMSIIVWLQFSFSFFLFLYALIGFVLGLKKSSPNASFDISRENSFLFVQVHRACAEREILDMLDHPFLPALYASFQVRKSNINISFIY